MDHFDRMQDETTPENSPDRPPPTRFGRGKRHLDPRPAPASRSDAGETDTVPATDDELVFEDRGGL